MPPATLHRSKLFSLTDLNLISSVDVISRGITDHLNTNNSLRVVLAPLVDSEFKDTSDVYTADEVYRTENVLDSPFFLF